MATYKLKQPFAEYPCLPCAVKGKGALDLSGKGYEKEIPASGNRPAYKVQVKGATAADLRDLYENPDKYGNFKAMIEKIETPPAKSSK
jgi:hypothetical protein